MKATIKALAGSPLVFLVAFGLLSPAPAAGGAVLSEFDIPQPPALVPCLGEQLAGLFRVREVLNVHGSANGGLHVVSNSRLRGILTGLTSGTVWTFRGASNVRLNAQGQQSSSTATQPLTGVSPGNGPVVVAQLRLVTIVNANGDVSTAYFLNSIQCHGSSG